MFEYNHLLLFSSCIDFFAETLRYHFQKRGWGTHICADTREALRWVSLKNPCVIIVDMEAPESRRFCRSLKVRKEIACNPLILLFPSSDALDRIHGMLILGDDNLIQPFGFKDLLNSVDVQVVQSRDEERLYEHRANFYCSSDERSLDQTVELMHELLEQSSLSEEGQIAVSVAFREAMLNAAWHGHRYNPAKHIDTLYLLDREKIRIVVRDTGPGFDHRRMLQKIEEEALDPSKSSQRKGGLGIIIMLRCCDRVEYNHEGNQVTLTKYLNPV
jgi:anti-sigma regulatory factor (Ser/Thr protein kinase)